MKLAKACAQVNEADTIVIDMKYTWGSDVNKAIINALMECAVSGTDIDARFDKTPERITCINRLIINDLVSMRRECCPFPFLLEVLN